MPRLIAAETLWDNEGAVKPVKPLQLDVNKKSCDCKPGKATTPGHVWTANSPDLNPAEHAVAGIVDKTKIAQGSYTLAQLETMVKERWETYAQSSLDASIMSMPGRLKAVEVRKGWYLLKGKDY